MSQDPHKSGVLRPKQVRGANSAVVLQLLRRFDSMSRAEIARQSGLSEGTVSRIVADLIDHQLVSEVGAENSTGGRPATRLQLSDLPRAVGVEIQNWETRFAIATTRGNLIETEAVRTPSTPDGTLQLIAERVREYTRRHPGLIQGIGITARGIVNSRTGVVEMGNAPGWVQIPLRSSLEMALRLPVYVENDVRAAALAEYNYTHAGEHAHGCLLYVRVDEGVGVGIVLNGKVYAGPSMSAGEFGQMVIADDRGPERHDRPGCLEKLVSNSAICDRFAASQGKTATASADSAGRVRRICQRALDGDRDAETVLRDTGRYLGLGIANLAWGLDPEAIVLNTTMNIAWRILLDAMQSEMPAPQEWPTFRKLDIRQSALGEQAPLIGAATLAFAPVFEAAEVRLIAERTKA